MFNSEESSFYPTSKDVVFTIMLLEMHPITLLQLSEHRLVLLNIKLETICAFIGTVMESLISFFK